MNIVSEKKKRTFGWWVVAAAAVGGVVVGAMAGAVGTGATTEPATAAQPVTKTITETDPTCREASELLYGIMLDQHTLLTEPLLGVVELMVPMLGGFPDVSELDRAADVIEGVAADADWLTGRVEEMAPVYQACVAP